MAVTVCVGPNGSNVSDAGLTDNAGPTATEIVVVSELPSVTVMVAEPAACGVTVTVVPDTDTVATLVFDELALNGAVPLLTVDVCAADAGSVKLSVLGEQVGGMSTVTGSVAELPLGMASVTVMVQLPLATGVTVMVVPETVAVAMLVFEDETL